MADGHDEPDLRFSLAGERTLLAYQRTSAALMVAALGFAHFLDEGALLLVLCLVLAAGAAIASVGGHARYVAANRAIESGRPLDPTRVPLLLTGTLAVALVLSVIMIVTKAG